VCLATEAPSFRENQDRLGVKAGIGGRKGGGKLGRQAAAR